MKRIGQVSRRPSLGRSKVALILVLFLVLSIFVPLALLLSRPAIPTVNIPANNAVDTLNDACSRMTGHIELSQLAGEKSIEELTDAVALRTFLAENTKPMQLYELAVKQDCVPVVDYTQGLQTLYDDKTFANFRTSFYAPRAAARLAQLEDRPNDAAKIYAEIFALGSKYGNEGVLIHAQQGFTFERLALIQLKELADSLDTATRKMTREAIESVNRQPRNIDAILRQEQVLAGNDYGVFQTAYIKLMTRGMTNDGLKMTQDTDAQIITLLGEVIGKLK